MMEAEKKGLYNDKSDDGDGKLDQLNRFLKSKCRTIHRLPWPQNILPAAVHIDISSYHVFVLYWLVELQKLIIL